MNESIDDPRQWLDTSKRSWLGHEYACYAVRLARHHALPYACLVGLLGALASELAAARSMSDDGSAQINWQATLTGVALVLMSFVAQLAGHALHEEFAAPPHLFHGFVAAPLLILFRLRPGAMSRNEDADKEKAATANTQAVDLGD